jgi:hypothetical protein
VQLVKKPRGLGTPARGAQRLPTIPFVATSRTTAHKSGPVVDRRRHAATLLAVREIGDGARFTFRVRRDCRLLRRVPPAYPGPVIRALPSPCWRCIPSVLRRWEIGLGPFAMRRSGVRIPSAPPNPLVRGRAPRRSGSSSVVRKNWVRSSDAPSASSPLPRQAKSSHSA